MAKSPNHSVRNLVLILGDQLDSRISALDGFDGSADLAVMMEVAEEASYVPQHKVRLTLFFSAMRHFRDALRSEGIPLHYVELEDPENRGSFAGEVARLAAKHRPERLIVTQPGDYRVVADLRRTAEEIGRPLVVRPDRHFFCDEESFEAIAGGRRGLRMETFYRQMRQRFDVLMEDGAPTGGSWNFDKENRGTFGKSGPGKVPRPRSFAPDKTTREVMAMVARRFADSPGRLTCFDYPVTAAQARAALEDFVEHRLSRFGRYQDAMAEGEPFLYHSRLSCVLNLHLLDPRDAVSAALQAYENGTAPIAAVEGFVRQILGWREFVRGIYWREMPGYSTLNRLEANLPAPALLWTGDTEMACVRDAVGGLVDHAYAHHIQRLMVLGLLGLLLGVRPYEMHRWHMSMYADAIDWVSLPNVLGMSQYGDGGIVGSKPYAASGNYIRRMSDHCARCRFDPTKATGPDACPFTTLYWDFLDRNRGKLRGLRHMGYQIANLDRKDKGERTEIARRADRLKKEMTAETYLRD